MWTMSTGHSRLGKNVQHFFPQIFWCFAFLFERNINGRNYEIINIIRSDRFKPKIAQSLFAFSLPLRFLRRPSPLTHNSPSVEGPVPTAYPPLPPHLSHLLGHQTIVPCNYTFRFVCNFWIKIWKFGLRNLQTGAMTTTTFSSGTE